MLQMKNSIQELTAQRSSEKARADEYEAKVRDMDDASTRGSTVVKELQAKLIALETEAIHQSSEVNRLQQEAKAFHSKISRLEKENQSLLQNQELKGREVEDIRNRLQESHRLLSEAKASHVQELLLAQIQLQEAQAQQSMLPTTDESKRILLEAELAKLKEDIGDLIEVRRSIITIVSMMNMIKKIIIKATLMCTRSSCMGSVRRIGTSPSNCGTARG